MTEAAIQAGFTRDLYVSLGEPTGSNGWSFKIQYKPFVRWIWLAGIMMACGGILAATDRRYRLTLRRSPQELAGSNMRVAEATGT
jgi:cytochrome c-type biogenesis protein CcmF